MIKNISSRDIVPICVNGVNIVVADKQSVAAALLGAGITSTGNAQREDRETGPFCMMGVCYSCLVEIDGAQFQRGCMVEVQEDMVINTGADYESI
ncbi:(2Fe-2S)-binding protein [Psychromonas ossibalaenae]|uniref:(2Fe-2S)-binding protein n=1 Tax=Psychromonas ossibalaenae TaxID=444922 RepID=UPI0003701EBD|nr:(2Fe-2S)-binding protein [Psychromonas ossibalaenae]